MTRGRSLSTRGSITTAAVLAGLTSLVVPGASTATEKYAAETGVPCAQCHQYPTGDARLTPFGKSFVANGFKLPTTGPKPPTNGPKPPSSDTPPPK